MAELHNKINFKGEVDSWARIAIERFRKELKKKKIYGSGNLYNSFEKQLEMSGTDVRAVYIRFALYGRFVDMGVGSGLKAYERKSNKAFLIAAKRYGADVEYVRRQPRRWFNKPKMAQIYRLREILERSLDHAIVTNIQDQLSSPDQTQYQVRI